MAKAKRGLSKEQERRRYDYVDEMVVYLECAAFEPPVSLFVPLIEDMLNPLFPKASRFAAKNFATECTACGLIAGAEPRSGAKFAVYTCEPLSAERVRRLCALMPVGSDTGALRGAQFARVSLVNVHGDGRVTGSFPRHYQRRVGSRSEFCWFPVVMPRVGRKVTVATGGGINEYTEVVSDYTGMAPGIVSAFTGLREAVWSVRVSAVNGRSELLLFTDEAGATGFFNLRSAPTTASGRKAALQHWVREHARKGQAHPTPVRGHLRGAEEFDWMGLRCRVDPPTELAERAAGQG